MANRLNESQSLLLIELMEKYPIIAQTSIGSGKRSTHAIARMWKVVAQQLNAVENGTTKSSDMWKRYWINLKSRLRTRAALERKDREANGCVLKTEPDMNEYDQRVLALVGIEPAMGDVTLKRIAVMTDAPKLSPPSRASVSPVPPRSSCSPEPFPQAFAEPFSSAPTPSPQAHRVRTPPRHDKIHLLRSMTPSPLPPCIDTPSPNGPSRKQLARAGAARRGARRKPAVRTDPYCVTASAPPEWFVAAEATRAKAADRRAAKICHSIERAIEQAGERQERAIDRLTAVLSSFKNHL